MYVKKYEQVFLKPGELLVSAEKLILTTVLGTCVSVCLYDPQARLGGMNHYMLPDGHDKNSAKYGNHANEMLIKRMLILGASIPAIQARVYGGSDVPNSIFQIGRKNAELALNQLQQWNITISGMDLGGHTGRRIDFMLQENIIKVSLLS